MRYLLILAFSSLNFLYAQRQFEPAYRITDDGTRQDILLLDRDRLTTSGQFRYRAAGREATLTGSVTDTREVGFSDGRRRLVRYTVAIDLSSDRSADLSTSATPEFVQRTVFLEVLVEGQAELLRYRGIEGERYFVRVQGAVPQSLISRRYRESSTTIQRQDFFRGMLAEELRCGDGQSGRVAQRLSYTQKDLSSFVAAYNRCMGDEATRVVAGKRGKVTLAFRPGIEQGSLSRTAFNSGGSTRSELAIDGLGYRFGAELEYRPPVAHQSWALFTEVYYHRFTGERTSVEFGRNYVNYMYYESIGLPLGLRKYVTLGGRLRAFVNAAVVYNFATRTSGIRRNNLRLTTIGHTLGFDFGGGLTLADRYLLEVRYAPYQGPVYEADSVTIKQKGISFIVGYRLFGGGGGSDGLGE